MGCFFFHAALYTQKQCVCTYFHHHLSAPLWFFWGTNQKLLGLLSSKGAQHPRTLALPATYIGNAVTERPSSCSSVLLQTLRRGWSEGRAGASFLFNCWYPRPSFRYRSSSWDACKRRNTSPSWQFTLQRPACLCGQIGEESRPFFFFFSYSSIFFIKTMHFYECRANPSVRTPVSCKLEICICFLHYLKAILEWIC